ncbi:MAG TPA: hypothetical protein VF483_07475 [Gemmatimonadaceae bacterium]
MTAPRSTPERQRTLLGFAATVALVAGAVGALALFFTNARNAPAILIFLYTGWVLLPHVSLAIGRRMMTPRSASAGFVMNIVALAIVGGGLAAYVALLTTHAARPAAVFLLVPLASQALAGVGFAVAASRGRPSSSQSSA